jgi:hypothetical protein
MKLNKNSLRSFEFYLLVHSEFLSKKELNEGEKEIINSEFLSKKEIQEGEKEIVILSSYQRKK